MKTRKEKRAAINEQFKKSIDLGFITQKQLDEYRAKKRKEKEKKMRGIKPIIYGGMNTCSM